MGKLKKILAVICAMLLIFSVPSVGLASYQERMENLNKKADAGRADIEERITLHERFFELKKISLNVVEKEIEDWQKKIDDLIKQHENHKTGEEYIAKIDCVKCDLLKEKDNLNTNRDILDYITAFSLSDNVGKDDNDLKLSTDMAQKNYDDVVRRVDELENRLKELNIEENNFKNFETDLKVLNEEKLKCENEREALQKDIENCEKKYNELLVEKLNFEEEIKNEIYELECLDIKNKKNVENWNRILAGDQCKDNVLDGQIIGLTCGIFASTNAINYFNCIKDNKQPIQGFRDVINHYLNNGGKRENLNKVLSIEELIEYVCNNNINIYNLGYEERISNIPELDKEKQMQIANVEEFLLAHFKSNNDSPVLNLNRGHWQAFVAYDAIDNKLLLVDSSPAKVEWVDLHVVAQNSIAMVQDKLNWQWLFLSKDKQSDSDFFGVDLGRPLTNELKKQVIDKLSNNF